RRCFRRADKGQALLPMLIDSFGRIAAVLEQFRGGRYRRTGSASPLAFLSQRRVEPLVCRCGRDRNAIAARSGVRLLAGAALALALALALASAAAQGAGIALLPVGLFGRELRHQRLVQPFPIEVVAGRYWLTRL